MVVTKPPANKFFARRQHQRFSVRRISSRSMARRIRFRPAGGAGTGAEPRRSEMVEDVLLLVEMVEDVLLLVEMVEDVLLLVEMVEDVLLLVEMVEDVLLLVEMVDGLLLVEMVEDVLLLVEMDIHALLRLTDGTAPRLRRRRCEAAGVSRAAQGGDGAGETEAPAARLDSRGRGPMGSRDVDRPGRASTGGAAVQDRPVSGRHHQGRTSPENS